MERKVLFKKNGVALVDLGTQYVVACNYNDKDGTWRQRHGTSFFANGNNQRALLEALDLFLFKTEDNYITRHRLEEIATKYKDELVANTTLEEVIEYSEEELDMDDYELEFFGLSEEEGEY